MLLKVALCYVTGINVLPYHLIFELLTLENDILWGTLLAQEEEHATFDFGIMSLSPTLGEVVTKKKKKNPKRKENVIFCLIMFLGMNFALPLTKKETSAFFSFIFA